MQRPMQRLALALTGIITAVSLSACGGGEVADPEVESDSNQSYGKLEDGTYPKIPTDTKVYNITGEVVSQVNSVTRQTERATGEMYGSAYGMSGTFYGPMSEGKGFIRILVDKASPALDEAKPGDVSILKMTDTKGTALLPGDVVDLKCHRQYEAVAAVQENQKFDVERDGTWELDYCRLASPVITVTPLKQ
jgi:hypothetical protein